MAYRQFALIEGTSAVWVTPPGALRVGRGGGEAYADAVVTPPSTTMVWPVMKLEASEPR